jgi:small subunit ribosomal protein S17
MAKKQPEKKNPGKVPPVKAITPAAPPVEVKPVAAPAPAPVAEVKPAAAPAPVAAPVAAAPAVATPAAPSVQGFRRKLVGKVTSNKMNKTVVVEVVRSSVDPVYKKYVRVRDRYKAHDEQNQYKVGDRVEISEHRPISRDKRWLVTKLITRAVEE